MKTFTRHRNTKELRKACDAKGFPYDQSQFDRGSDHVSFRFKCGDVTAQVCYSSVNGRAFGEFWRGENGKKEWFSTDRTAHETRRWFKALLDFIYVP